MRNVVNFIYGSHFTEDVLKEYGPIHARQLWKFFKNKQKFADWMKIRLSLYRSESGSCRCYRQREKPSTRGGNVPIKYRLSLPLTFAILLGDAARRDTAVQRFFRSRSEEELDRLKVLFFSQFPELISEGDLWEKMVAASQPPVIEEPIREDDEFLRWCPGCPVDNTEPRPMVF